MILYVREEQMAEMSKYMSQRFENRITHLIQELSRVKNINLTDDKIRAQIQKGRRSATNYGLKRACDVAGFIELYFLLAPDFERNPKYKWIMEILKDDQLYRNDKIKFVYERLSYEQEPSEETL